LVGGATAGLVGLIFVAITVGSGQITKENVSGLRTFLNPILIHFIYVLVTASVVVIPLCHADATRDPACVRGPHQLWADG